MKKLEELALSIEKAFLSGELNYLIEDDDYHTPEDLIDTDKPCEAPDMLKNDNKS